MAKWVTIILAVLGLAMGIWTVATSGERLPRPEPARPPSVNPFAHGIAAAGLVEAASRNIAVAPPEAGLAVEVSADVNDAVKAGQALFRMDRRPVEADLVRARAALEVARAELARVKAAPRAEDLPPLQAAVDEAKVRLADVRDQLQRAEEMQSRVAATQNEVARLRFAAGVSEAALAAAEANLARARAGSWSEDIRVVQARVAAAEADILALGIRLDRLTVRAPIDGTVLKRFIEPGEYAAPGAGDPAMVLGDISTLHVRAQVDEEDAPQLRAGARAVARLRGSVAAEFPLRMLRIEPWAQGKSQITGETAERVDTRVVEAVFEVERGGAGTRPPLYLGQLVDVFIEAPASATQPGTNRQPEEVPGGG